MVEWSWLRDFRLVPASGGYNLRLIGDPLYARILSGAFETLELPFEPTGDSRFWIEECQCEKTLRALLELLRRIPFMQDTLDESFCLATHLPEEESNPASLYPDGEIRLLLAPVIAYEQKKNGASERRALGYAERLAGMACRFVLGHPTYAGADAVVAIPPEATDNQGALTQNTRFHLARLVAARIVEQTDALDAGAILKRQSDSGTFVVRGDVTGATVLLVDGCYPSQARLGAVADAFRRSGAHQLLGLALHAEAASQTEP